MAYGTKYKVSYPDYFDDDVEVLLQKNEYSGGITQLRGTGNPLAIRHESSTDLIHEPINGSRAIIQIAPEVELDFFVEFQQYDAREWKVIINVNTGLYWSGFILSELCLPSYNHKPEIHRIVATDQLGYLRSLSWNRAGPYTDLDILEACLGETDLDLNMYEGINVYEEHHNSTAADSPLDQTYVNASAYAGKTYYDALYAVLFRYGAIIRQSNGTWQITRPKESRETFTRRLWTYAAGTFTYDSTAEYNPIVAITTAGRTMRMKIGGSKAFESPWNRYNLIQNLGKRETFVENAKFEKWTAGTPDNWTNVNNLDIQENGSQLELVSVAVHDPTKYLTQTFPLERSQVQKLKINVKYNMGSLSGGGTLDMQFQVIITNAGTDYYWDPTTVGWSMGAKNYEEQISTGGTQELEIITAALNVGTLLDGTLKIRLLAPVTALGSGVLFIDEFLFSIVDFDWSGTGGWSEYTDEIEHDEVINAANTYDAGKFELLSSDIPQLVNSGLIYIGGVWLDSDYTDAALLWEDSDGTEAALVELLINSLTQEHLHATTRLTGVIYAPYDSLQITDTLQDSVIDNKKYIIHRAIYDSRHGRWQIEAIELYEDAYLMTESSDYLVTEDGKRLKLW